MPGPFSVVLTNDGALYVPGGFGIGLFNESSQDAILSSTLASLSNFVNNQMTIENKINAILGKYDKSLLDLLNTRTDGNAAKLFEQQRKDLSAAGEQLAISETEYLKEKENLQQISQLYYSTVQSVIRRIARLAQNNNLNVNEIQNIINSIDSEIGEVEAIERSMLESVERMLVANKTVEKRLDIIHNISTKLDSQSPVTITKTDSGFDVQMPKKAGQANLTKALTGQNGLLAIINESSNELTGKELRNLVHINQKYNKRNSLSGRLRKAYDNLVDTYARYIQGPSGKLTNRNKQYARDAIYEILTNLGVVDNSGNFLILPTQSMTVITQANEKKGINSLAGEYAELQFVDNINNKINAIIPELSIQAFHSGGQATRKITLKGDLTYFPPESSLPKNLGVDTSLLNAIQKDAKDATKYYDINKTQMVQDKVDDYLNLTDPDTKETFTIAFSDKLYSSYGGFNIENIHIVNDSNLLNSLDLFQGADSSMPTDQLLFLMLNMSSASIYSDEGTKSKIKDFIQNMISAHFADLAFNKSNFVKSFDNVSPNVLYISSVNNFYAPLSRTLQGVMRQISSKDLIEDIVKAEVQFDTAHSSSGLYSAALATVPPRGHSDPNKDARWAYVANQVAANTKISVSMNLAALTQLFSY